MKAIGLTRYLPATDPECFQAIDLPDPVATGRDLLVRVHAVSVNPVDTKIRAPKEMVESNPRVLGWDAAGIVEAIGGDVSLFAVGDEVYYAGDIKRPGCDSQLHLVDERIVGHKPRSLTFDEAAALPLTTLTAWESLFDRLAIDPSPTERNRKATVLVIGGAGGVGSIAIQIAKRIAGLRVIATASREASATWCREMGADEIINHHLPFQEELKRIGVDAVEFILCFNSTEKHVQNMADAIRPQGKICLIVGAKGGQPLPINTFQSKSVALCWELMFTRPMFETRDMEAQHDILDKVSRAVEDGVLRTTVTESLGPLGAESLRTAHARIEAGNTIGKLVLGGIA